MNDCYGRLSAHSDWKYSRREEWPWGTLRVIRTQDVATRVCEHASRCWDDGSPEVVTAVVTAKHVGATQAARGAAAAVQVMASAGSRDGHVVARAYRDAKLMEIIEGSSEICRLVLARHMVNEIGGGS